MGDPIRQIEAHVPRLREMIRSHRWALLQQSMASWPVSAVETLMAALEPSERQALMWGLPPAQRVAVLNRLKGKQRDELLDGFADPEVARLLDGCGDAELGRLLAALPAAAADRVRAVLRSNPGADADPTASYPAGSLGARMQTDVPTVLAAVGARPALAALFASGARLQDDDLVFLIDRAGRYRGWRRVAELRADTDLVTMGAGAGGTEAVATPRTPAERAIAHAHSRGWPAIAVVDAAGRLLGALSLTRARGTDASTARTAGIRSSPSPPAAT